MALVDVCRSPIRRKIMILAEEAAAKQEVFSASVALKKLGFEPYRLSSVSYHVKELVKAGALEVKGGAQKRGAWQKYLVPSKAFQATMTDTVALDQIAELIEEIGNPQDPELLWGLLKVLRATGRPVEA